MRSSAIVAITIFSAFIGGAATTLVLNSKISPMLAQTEGETPAPKADAAKEDAPVVKAPEKYIATKPVSGDEFRLVDSDGKLRGRFGFTADGAPNFFLYDSDGNEYPQGQDMIGVELIVKIEKEANRLLAVEEHTEATVELQHVLIAFQGAERSRNSQSREQAAKAAWDLYEQAKQEGTDFGQLMKDNSDDPGPGIYTLTTATPPADGAYPRGNMIKCFGDLGWRLKVGEVGITNYDPKTGAFGYHIIKRLK